MTRLEKHLRLATGLILAVFITQHLLNHSIGLISLPAMEAVRETAVVFWRSAVGGSLVYFSLIAHFLLALWSLYRRTTLRMSGWELAQLALGLSVIPLLSGHVAATWGGRYLLDAQISYESVISAIFNDPWLITKQFLLVATAWLHVCVGLHFWLRLKRWYRKYLPIMYAVVVLVPVLSVLAVVRVGFELGSAAAADPYTATGDRAYDAGYSGDYGSDYGDSNSGDEYSGGYGKAANGKELISKDVLNNGILLIFYGLLGLTLLARLLRYQRRRKYALINVSHPTGKKLTGLKGQTLLETIRDHGVPHASVCGGRARCTTCRVRIDRGLDVCPAPSALERQALTRINAEHNVRLACQTRPRGDLQITPLVAVDEGLRVLNRPGAVKGTERQVVAMFVDLRGSTQMGERRLPYDVLFILNRFFLEMTDVLQQTHGHYAQFAGDGLMALYGLNRGLAQGCKDAIEGAIRMQQRIDKMNEYFEAELDQPLRIGIGVHCGEAIVGTMGPPTSPNYSAIGDNINTAARLESLTKELDCTLVVSTAAVEQAGCEMAQVPQHTVTVRGKTRKLEVYAVGLDALASLSA